MSPFGHLLIEKWHEFYLMAGTAAVTLAGLLFVAISFHLDALLDDARAHLLQLARQTLMSFVYVLIVSLLFLVPDAGARATGLALGGTSLAMLAIAGRFSQRDGVFTEADPRLRFLGRRMRLMLVGYAVGATIGILMALQRDADWSYAMMAVIPLALANAAGTSWDLLVEVGRMRRAGTTNAAGR